jgi:hypothetical protein
MRPLAISSRACRSMRSLGTTATRQGVTARSVAIRRPWCSRAISPRIAPGADLGHRRAVDLHPQHPVEQEEQLGAGLALPDQGPAGLKPTEPRLGVDDRHRQLALQRRLHRGHDRGRVLGPQGVWAPNASRHQASWSMKPLLATSRPR